MNNHNEQGSIIIFALLMLIVMMAIAGSLASVFLGKVRIVNESVLSTQAIFAADTGTEVCLYEARKQVGPISRAALLTTTTATFTIASLSSPVLDVSSNCRPLGVNSFTFRVVGTYKNVSRALEVSQ